MTRLRDVVYDVFEEAVSHLPLVPLVIWVRHRRVPDVSKQLVSLQSMQLDDSSITGPSV